MPTRKVTFPDGHVEHVDVPKGAPREDVIKAATLQRAPQFEKDARATKNASAYDLAVASPPGRFVTGLADPHVGAMQAMEEVRGGKLSPIPPVAAVQAITQGLGLRPPVKDVVKSREEALRRGDQAYGREGADYARTAGNIMSPYSLLAMKGNPQGLLPRIGYSSAVGTGFGATTPLEEGGLAKRAQLGGIGGVLGAGIPALGAGLHWGGATLRNILEPAFSKARVKGNVLLNAAGDKAEDVYNLLRRHKTFVPGAKPTAGEAAAPAGSAEFAAVQKTVGGHRPSAYLAKARGQDNARVASIDTIAKTPKAIKRLESARSIRGARNYAKAWVVDVKADKNLVEMSKSPYFHRAIKDAAEIATTDNINPKSMHFLHLVKRSLDKQLEKVGDGALGSEQRRAVQGLKSRLVDWMDEKSPAYKVARLRFERDSKPIARAEIGQELKKVLSQPISNVDEVGAQRTGPFVAAVQDSSKVAKRAGLDPRFGEIGDILTPNEMNRVDNVVKDLVRRTRFEEQARAGTKTVKGDILTDFLDDRGGGKSLPRVLDRTVVILNYIIDRARGRATKDIQEDLALDMLDPEATAKILKKAMVSKTRRDAIMKIIGQAEVAATTGAAQNLESGSLDTVTDLLGVSP